MRHLLVAALFAALLFLLLHTDNLALKSAALVVNTLISLIAALTSKRLRLLFVVDAVVTALITALLIAAVDTFVYYRWGWLVHEVVALALLMSASGRIRIPTFTRLFYWLLVGASALSLTAALILLPPHFTLVDFVLVFWTLGVLPLIAAATLGDQIALTTDLFRPPFLIGLVVLGVALSLWSIRFFPNWSATDEATIFDTVDTYQRTGVIEVSMVPYDAPTVTGNLYLYAALTWLRALPDNPYALRLFSMLGGLGLVVVAFWLTRELADGQTAWIAVALLATNLLWIAVSHVGRQESWLAVAVWLAVGLTVAAQRRDSWLLAVISGVIAALSADVHPLGAYGCLALGIYWLISWRSSKTLIACFVTGGLFGAAYYVAVHVLPDSARFVRAIHDEAVSYGAEGWTPLAAMIQRHAAYAAANPLEFGLLVVGAVVGVRYQRRLGLFVIGLGLLYALTVADPNPYYPLVWIVGMIILTALALRHLRAGWRAPLMVALWAVFVLNAALIARHTAANWNDQALAAFERVAAEVPRQGSGMGEAFLYLPLRDPTYIGFPFVEFQAARQDLTRWQVVELLAPDWIVTMRDQTAFAPPFNFLSVDVPHMHLQIPDGALANDYQLTRTVTTSVGDFQIWQRRASGAR